DKQRKRRRATATLLFLVPFTLTCACLAIGAVRYYEIAEAPHVNTDSTPLRQTEFTIQQPEPVFRMLVPALNQEPKSVAAEIPAATEPETSPAPPITATPDRPVIQAQQNAHKQAAAKNVILRSSTTKQRSISDVVNKIKAAIDADNSAEAEKLFEHLADLKGHKSRYVLKLRAYWLIRSGAEAKAEEILNDVLERSPQDFEAGINMAVLELKTGRKPAARTRLRDLQRSHPGRPAISDLLDKL
ncbi:MAG: tetratricopeptide repeat protein, partial [Deltaproteobacteria bacterium]|nr:tetratricopeptide repeat protein [Deltaproteobacteria bacterium]